MANITIIQAHTAVYDGEHAYSFQVGEVHLVGGQLMPQFLHDLAIAQGWGVDGGSTASDVDQSEQTSATQADSPVNFTPQGL